MQRWLTRSVLLAVLGLTFVLFLQGCTMFSSKPDIASEEKKSGQAYSSAEVRRMTVDQPFLVSGDYFRQREEKPSHEYQLPGSKEEEQTQDQGESAASESKQQTVASSSAAATAASQAEGHASKAVDAGKSYRLKLGLLLDEKALSLQDGRRLMQAAEQAAGSQNVLLVSDPTLREVLAPTDCLKNKDLQCVAETVSLYPGVRMLLLAESLSMPESYPGRATLRLNLVDTGLPHRYPIVEMSRQVADQAQADSFLLQAVKQAMATAADKAAVMPSHARVFSVKNERIFISAGQETGLEVGQQLSLVPGGERVDSPTGTPIDWLPNEGKSVLKLERFVAQDAAACSLVEGAKPKQGDYVLLEKAGE